ncbi:SusD/RagB family nutrient-binding outer membrane lipoprotein [Marinilongibacter aquaticus]|uniref:SusD/RagB family nutrient-binding outer membrane lipoprotein n=1 Tax=Marinilongibacter aquaticus TaxID=2975157 RepID=UPI0021BDDFCE|nr:SusD/RagB family nutrient-binding outer membrane lipoprotein [Marinilongibacter aquaticus]UBM59430.1 SusD/RagB family nutrient-binding outer membrane lipoprotein [Marinilongibacter aquaticus]
MKKILFLFISFIVFSGCTKNFEELNVNPYQISNESLRQDFNNIGSFYPSMLNFIFGTQTHHNLLNVTYTQQLATPTPFTGNINNTTYYVRWNTYWGREYSNVMAPAKQVIDIANEGGYTVFAAWAKLIQIISMSRVTLYQGPVIYTHYGETGQVLYDSEEELYTAFFSDLDEIIDMFNANADYSGLANFDASYGGDVASWARYANSLRLQLAMRVSKVAPSMAKSEGEKALADPAGLILSNDQTFYISLYGAKFHPATICFDWGDTRMSATMESILIGYKDNRISKFFDPVSSESLVSDHPDWPYKGIRNGAVLNAKDDHLAFSTINSSFNSISGFTKRKYMSADEVYFLMAEAALRGWTGAGDAKENYESGVKASFELWGAGGADAYLADDSSLPLDYVDPVDATHTNDFQNRITTTVAWDEAASNEEKLEKIITQKWIACYTNEMESWMDLRRTGYPKLPDVAVNYSSTDWGIVEKGDIVRRFPFVTAERTGNEAGVADATTKLGGPDLINTRLWWDTGGSNFP